MTEEVEEHCRNINICRFCEKTIESDIVKVHCHFRSLYRVPAHNKFNVNVTQKQSNFTPFAFKNFSIYDCHLFFKKSVDRKSHKVNFDILPKTNEECISVTYAYFRITDTYRFSSSSLGDLVETLDDDNFEILKKKRIS